MMKVKERSKKFVEAIFSHFNLLTPWEAQQELEKLNKDRKQRELLAIYAEVMSITMQIQLPNDGDCALNETLKEYNRGLIRAKVEYATELWKAAIDSGVFMSEYFQEHPEDVEKTKQLCEERGIKL